VAGGEFGFLSGDQRRRRVVGALAASMAMLIVGAVLWFIVAWLYGEKGARLAHWVPPPAADLGPEFVVREPAPLTRALRERGFHECNPPDPAGMGPYEPYRNVRMGGRMLIPIRGGHTQDMGFDVLLHFHGHEALRKTLVQVARGVVFVGFDKGLASGPYARAFGAPNSLRIVEASVTEALRQHTGDPRAHIRRLGLSAWSAGYGAINEILKYSADRVDAVVLLDGLHAGWDLSKPHARGVAAVTGAAIAPTAAYAERAVERRGIFIFTHSEIDPVSYPSTELTADYLLKSLGLTREAVSAAQRALPKGFIEVEPGEVVVGPFASTSKTDGEAGRYALKGQAHAGNFYVWSYKGGDERAHCSHLPHIAHALGLVIEPMWKTPPLDRSRRGKAPVMMAGARPGRVPAEAPTAETQPETAPAVEPGLAPGFALGATDGEGSAEL
jgi:hypothetical protein